MPSPRASARPSKASPTLGACGIDCGLCPRFHTAGASRCPGCGGPGFHRKHPSCGTLTCCAGRHGLEACSQCDEFPCPRVEAWSTTDSFVTHQRCRPNLEAVRRDGLQPFLRQQGRRARQLARMLAGFDEGRSKGLYCLAAALLPADALEAAVREASRRARAERVAADDAKARAALLRGLLQEQAQAAGVELRLRGR